MPARRSPEPPPPSAGARLLRDLRSAESAVERLGRYPRACASVGGASEALAVLGGSPHPSGIWTPAVPASPEAAALWEAMALEHQAQFRGADDGPRPGRGAASSET